MISLFYKGEGIGALAGRETEANNGKRSWVCVLFLGGYFQPTMINDFKPSAVLVF